MRKAIGVLVLIISVVYAHAQADFPKDSSMFKTLGWWEIRQKDSLYTSIGHRYMAGSNLLIESIYANDSQRFHLHNEYKCSNLYYTIYIKEYSMYLRRGINSIHETSNDYVSISKCSGNSIYSYVDICESISFSFYSYSKDFVPDKLDRNCIRLSIGKDEMIEQFNAKGSDDYPDKIITTIFTRLNEDEVKADTKHDLQRIFSDRFDLSFIKSQDELLEYYAKLPKDSYYYSCKEKLVTLSYLVKNFEGRWKYSNIQNGESAELKAVNLNGTAVLFVADTEISAETELLPTAYFTYPFIFPATKLWIGQIVANAKVKVPNLLLKFNINGFGSASENGNIMYIPTYVYIRDNKEKDIYNIFRDKFYSKYIKKEGNKYYFKSFIHYNKEIIGKDGKKYLVSRRRDVYLKWEINEDFSVVDEYLDLCDGNGWQHTVKFEKIK